MRLSSASRTGGTQEAPEWRLTRPISAYSVQVISVTIPNTIYNVPYAASWIDTSVGSASVAGGIYSPASLAAAVQAALIPLDATFTCVYDQAALAFVISRAAAFTILWATGPNAAVSLARPMGFSAVDLPALTVHTSDQATMLMGPSNILVRSRALSGGGPPGVDVIGTNNADVVARVPLSGGLGAGISTWSATIWDEDIYFGDSGSTIASIDAELWDEDSQQAVSLHSSVIPWSMEISVEVNEDKTRRRY